MRGFKRLLELLLGIICFATAAQAQSLSSFDNESTLNKIAAYFDRLHSFRGEKLWLHLDKPYYAAGDSIWFKGYLVDSEDHRPDTLSNFIHVDLVDRSGTIVLSKKVRRDDHGFSNAFSLPVTFPAGEYTLRAYTGWMLNFDPGFLLQRNIVVGNSITDRVNAEITYPAPEDGQKQAIVRFYNADKVPYSDINVRYELFDRNGKRLDGAEQKTTTTGAVFAELPADSVCVGGHIDLMVDNGELYYKGTFFFPDDSIAFAVQFFPEGGDLVVGQPQTVAFKGEGSNGFPAEVSGVVLTQRGDTAARFSSEHDGMGMFLLCPEAGAKYRAEAVNPSGQKVAVTLPPVKEAEYAFAVTQTPEELRYRIVAGTESRCDSMSVIAHVRGKCIAVCPVNPENPCGKWKTDSIPEGILHLVLLDGQLRPRSERLVFVSHPESRGRCTVIPDKPAYGKREKVCLHITLQNPDGNPLSGTECSISVTDNRTVKQDSLADNMLSNLLLCSDIRGYVHNPGYYFLNDGPKTRYYLDLVMRTHGWRRFDIGKIADTAQFRPKYYYEHGQYIAGHVVGLVGRSAPQAQVTAVAMNRDNVYGTATADDDGNYLIDALDFRDTTLFLITARTRKGKPVQRVSIDENYPKPAFLHKNPFERQGADLKEQMKDYLEAAKNKFTVENGMKVYTLPETVVRGENERKPKSSAYGTIYDTAALAKYKPMSLYNYVAFLPGTVRQGEQLFMKSTDYQNRRKGGSFDILYKPVTLSVNGKGCSVNELANYTVNDVEFINSIHMAETGGAIVDAYRVEIILKEGVAAGGSDIKAYKTIGYVESVEFYNPVYDTPEKQKNGKPDSRTTLYWNPRLSFGADGTARIEFYTDDNETPKFDVSIEGLGSNGKIYKCRNYNQTVLLSNGAK